MHRTRYPNIKGLTLEKFKNQIEHLERFGTFVTLDEVKNALSNPNDATLPPNAVVVTFDDGYLDHYSNVLPILYEKGIEGWFFPSVQPVLDREILEVNKIQFVLSVVDDHRDLMDYIIQKIDQQKETFKLASLEDYLEAFDFDSRFDRRDTAFVKQMLQYILPHDIRKILIDELFRSHVTQDEASFADELYMNMNQLRMMSDCGQVIGSHGVAHYWLGHLSYHEQAQEVLASVEFLDRLGITKDSRVFCYPFGSLNNNTVEIVKDAGYCLGLTTKVAVADLNICNPFRIPRLDTNDIS